MSHIIQERRENHGIFYTPVRPCQALAPPLIPWIWQGFKLKKHIRLVGGRLIQVLRATFLPLELLSNGHEKRTSLFN